MRRALLFAALLSGAGCTGLVGELEAPGQTDGGESSSGCVPQGPNDEVRLGLHRACAGCHTSGNKPFFASLEAFENGLVYDERYVIPGQPENSLLVKLLLGTAPGSYPQMPPGEPYSAQVADGRATLSVADIEQWIRELPPTTTRLAEPSPALFTVRRLTAEEMVVGLLDQLGLSVEDFVDTSASDWKEREWQVWWGRFFVWPTDWAPGISQGYVSEPATTERFEALGGPATLYYRRRDEQLGPAAAQTLVQMSLAWCARAVDKTGNTAVLRHVTLADRSSTNAAGIQQNIGALYLRMLGEVPSAADIDEVYQGVYVPYEATSTRAAWIGVCASFVRHPLWMTY